MCSQRHVLRWEAARNLLNEVNELIRILIQHPVFPATKLLLRWAGIECGECLAPRRRLGVKEEWRLREQLLRSRFAESFALASH